MLFGSPSFLTVRPGNLLWALPRVRWSAWRSFGSRRTLGRSSPPWACWGIGCVRPPSWVPPSPRAVGSRGRGLPPAMTVCPFLRRLSAIRLPIMPHISSHFFVGMHEFCATCVRFQEREKYWNDGQVHVFWGFWEQKQHIFRASTQVLHAWRGGFADVVFHICLACLIRWCDISYWLSAFEGEVRLGKIPVVTVVTIVTVAFHGMVIFSLSIYICLIYK